MNPAKAKRPNIFRSAGIGTRIRASLSSKDAYPRRTAPESSQHWRWRNVNAPEPLPSALSTRRLQRTRPETSDQDSSRWQSSPPPQSQTARPRPPPTKFYSSTKRTPSVYRVDPRSPKVPPRKCSANAKLRLGTTKEGCVLNLGRRTRVVSAKQMLALNYRDGCCRTPGCGRTRFLHAHHVKFLGTRRKYGLGQSDHAVRHLPPRAA